MGKKEERQGEKVLWAMSQDMRSEILATGEGGRAWVSGHPLLACRNSGSFLCTPGFCIHNFVFIDPSVRATESTSESVLWGRWKVEERDCTWVTAWDLAAGDQGDVYLCITDWQVLDSPAPTTLSGNAMVFSSIGTCFDRCWVATKSLSSQSPCLAVVFSQSPCLGALLIHDEWELPHIPNVCSVETQSLSLAPWWSEDAFLKWNVVISTSGTGVRFGYSE